MRITAVQHVPFEGPGSIRTWADRAGHEFSTVCPYLGDAPPSVSEGELLVVLGGPMSVHDEARLPWLAGERVVGLQCHLETTPAGVRELIANAAEELVEGPYIQQPLAMLGHPARFAAIHSRMRALLDRLVGTGSGRCAG